MGMRICRNNELDDYDYPPPPQQILDPIDTENDTDPVSNDAKSASLDRYIQRVAFVDVAHAPRPEKRMSIKEARKYIKKAAKRKGNIINRWTPGTGKTTSMADHAKEMVRLATESSEDDAQSARIMITAPTTELAKEIEALLYNVENVVRYEPRNESNCKYSAKCKRYTAIGKSPFDYICKTICFSFQEDNCCKYLSQLEILKQSQKYIVVCTHAAAPYILDREEASFDLVIIDESPTDKIVKIESMQSNIIYLLQAGMQELPFFKKLHAAIQESKKALEDTGAGLPKKFMRLHLSPTPEIIEQMLDDEVAWEGFIRHQRRLDEWAHAKACEAARNAAIAYNRELPKFEKNRRKQYKIDRKNHELTAKRAGLTLQETYPEYVPLQERAPDIPPIQVTPLPDRKEWLKAWKAQTLTPSPFTDAATTTAGIEPVDYVEGALLLAEFERDYAEDAPGMEFVDSKEFEIFRKIFCGEQASYAYLDVTAIRTKKKEIKLVNTFKCLKKITWALGEARLVILDGTADPEELEATFERKFELIQIDAELEPMHSIHICQGLGSSDAKKIIARKEKYHIEVREDILRYLKTCVKHLQEKDKHVLLLTHKVLKDELLSVAKESFPEILWEIAWFYGNRGVNAFADCDAVIAIGTPYMTPIESGPMAQELFPDPGQQSAWMSRLGLRELIQSIHRIRPINHPTTVVVLGRDFPTEAFELTRKIDARRKGGRKEILLEVVERLVPVAQELGCISKAIARSVGCIEETDLKAMEACRAKGMEPLGYPEERRWGEVLARIVERTGLTPMRRRAVGKAGRYEQCAGEIRSVQKWCWTNRIAFDPKEWISGDVIRPKITKAGA